MNNQDDNGTFVRNRAVNVPLSRVVRNFRENTTWPQSGFETWIFSTNNDPASFDFSRLKSRGGSYVGSRSIIRQDMAGRFSGNRVFRRGDKFQQLLLSSWRFIPERRLKNYVNFTSRNIPQCDVTSRESPAARFLFRNVRS